jgi:broad-specificity NMP kinase
MYGTIVILRMNRKRTETRLVHKGYFAVSVNAEIDADI